MHKATKFMAAARLRASRIRTDKVSLRDEAHYFSPGDVFRGEAGRHICRHLVMRLSLAGVFVWFGAQQLYDPLDWTEFVPSFVSDRFGIGDAPLVRLHGFLLVVASVGLISGLYVSAASILGVVLLSQIIFGLVVENGDENLIARDLALFGLAIGLALDPTRARWSDVFTLPKG